MGPPGGDWLTAFETAVGAAVTRMAGRRAATTGAKSLAILAWGKGAGKENDVGESKRVVSGMEKQRLAGEQNAKSGMPRESIIYLSGPRRSNVTDREADPR